MPGKETLALLSTIWFACATDIVVGLFWIKESSSLSVSFQFDWTLTSAVAAIPANLLVCANVIRPPLPSTPAVFELKNANQNIKGRVR